MSPMRRIAVLGFLAGLSLASLQASLPAAGIGIAHADSGCSQTARSLLTRWNTRRYPYAIRGTTVPGGSSGVSRIIDGHHAWNNSANPCGLSDITDFTTDFTTSDTSIGVHSSPDGYNRVDFGVMSNVGCNGAALACTFGFRGASGYIYETDTRFNSGYGGWNVSTSCTGTYDMWSVSAHETGHGIGLDDVYSSADWLTMYGYYTANPECRKRDLGYGDVLGLRANYP